VVGYGPFSLCVIHKEGLCPSSGDINILMIAPLADERNGIYHRISNATINANRVLVSIYAIEYVSNVTNSVRYESSNKIDTYPVLQELHFCHFRDI
jgi:hypothetical protein